MGIAVGGIISAVIVIVGAGISAYSAVEAGQQAEAAGAANRKLLRTQAEQQQQAADVAQAQFRERLRRTQGLAAANIGASGVQAEGSPLLSLIDNAQQGELQARLIDYGGKVKAYESFAQADAASFEARTAARQSYFTAGGYAARGASYAVAGSTLLAGGTGQTTQQTYGSLGAP
jgi:hypothetical protein